MTQADPVRFRDPSIPPHRFWAILDEPDRLWGNFAHTTRSVLGLGLRNSAGFLSGVSLLIRFRPTRRSDSPSAPPRIHPKCCSDPEIHFGWPHISIAGTQRVPQTVLTLSRQVEECKPLNEGHAEPAAQLRRCRRAQRQGLTLVHFSAQPEPFWSHLPVYPCVIDWGEIMQPTFPTKYAFVEPKCGRV